MPAVNPPEPAPQAVAPFRVRYPVRIGDINYGGHMGNDKYLLLFHDARLSFLAALGASEKDIGGGTGLILSEAHVRFQAEIFLGEELEVSVCPRDLQAGHFTLNYQVSRAGQQVAFGWTTLVAFDYSRRRPTRLPESFRAALAALAQN